MAPLAGQKKNKVELRGVPQFPNRLPFYRFPSSPNSPSPNSADNKTPPPPLPSPDHKAAVDDTGGLRISSPVSAFAQAAAYLQLTKALSNVLFLLIPFIDRTIKHMLFMKNVTDQANKMRQQEKELIERHHTWLNDELTTKVNDLINLRKTHSKLEAYMSVKLSDVERKFSESSSSLTWYKDRVRELDLKMASLEQELLSSKDAASRTEEQSSAEISTLNKLVELYKESSEEWSKKVGELESVIKELEVSLLCSWLFK
ncbi:PREDICTED: nuclear-pore anchor-like [Ipomoea nil]|uniref:nuclear-pore anchor-like n=1 Tax=Ipomoea nil TaxID=35883 RepID=UPI00090154A8|nr:PREDICTED: nuclear-pore anchor-like [Ipomoea nil]